MYSIRMIPFLTSSPIRRIAPRNDEMFSGVDVIQSASEEPLQFCPYCGLDVRRIISAASFKLAGELPQYDKAGRKGFTTFRRAEKGVWERIDGPGPDYMVGTKEDIAAVEAEKAPKKKVIDLDNG